jgi:hypothetical protein
MLRRTIGGLLSTRRLSHGGNQVGACAALVLVPEAGLTCATRTNLEDIGMSRLTRGNAQILRKHPVKTP